MNRSSRLWMRSKELHTIIEQVRELHRRGHELPDYCLECEHKYPCPTLRILDGEQE